MRTEQLFIPEIGESLNSLIYPEKGWMVYRTVKRRVEKACMVAGAFHVEQFAKPVTLAFYPKLGPKRRKRDVTNAIATTKMIEDVLVQHGVLREDNADYVRGIFLGAPERAADGVEGMLVVIREVDGSLPPEQVGLELQEVSPF